MIMMVYLVAAGPVEVQRRIVVESASFGIDHGDSEWHHVVVSDLQLAHQKGLFAHGLG